jgi:ubiquinone/menaquinone biosynthesis C-methylase UbiE
MPTTESVIRAALDRDASWLFDAFAGLYAWFTAQSAWRASCGQMAGHLPAPNPGHRPIVLDLGCGPGVSTFELAGRRPDARYVGLDRAPRMLAEARQRQRRLGGAACGIVWLRGDAGALPIAAGSVDAVTGHSFLYLLGEPTRSRALPEMLRVLRPGGRLVLMEPCARPADLRRVLRVSADPRHLLAVSLWRPFSRLHVRYTPASLAATLERAGFVRTRVCEVLGGLGLMARAQKPG